MKVIFNTFDMRLPFIRFTVSDPEAVEYIALNITNSGVIDIDDITKEDKEVLREQLVSTYVGEISDTKGIEISLSPYVTYTKVHKPTMTIKHVSGENNYKWNPNLGAMTPNTYVGIDTDELTADVPSPVDFCDSFAMELLETEERDVYGLIAHNPIIDWELTLAELDVNEPYDYVAITSILVDDVPTLRLMEANCNQVDLLRSLVGIGSIHTSGLQVHGMFDMLTAIPTNEDTYKLFGKYESTIGVVNTVEIGEAIIEAGKITLMKIDSKIGEFTNLGAIESDIATLTQAGLTL